MREAITPNYWIGKKCAIYTTGLHKCGNSMAATKGHYNEIAACFSSAHRVHMGWWICYLIRPSLILDFLTALLEYLDLEGVRLCSLFSKSERTSYCNYLCTTLHNTLWLCTFFFPEHTSCAAVCSVLIMKWNDFNHLEYPSIMHC